MQDPYDDTDPYKALFRRLASLETWPGVETAALIRSESSQRCKNHSTKELAATEPAPAARFPTASTADSPWIGSGSCAEANSHSAELQCP